MAIDHYAQSKQKQNSGFYMKWLTKEFANAILKAMYGKDDRVWELIELS